MLLGLISHCFFKFITLKHEIIKITLFTSVKCYVTMLAAAAVVVAGAPKDGGATDVVAVVVAGGCGGTSRFRNYLMRL